MEENKAFRRHLKQHVHAPEHRFAAVVPPELTSLCVDEMKVLGFPETEVTEAGVEFNGKLSFCYMANLMLRTPSRILCRLPEFRAGISEELFHKVSVMRWELWLNPGIPLQIEAHVEYSRIEHEGVVAETVLAGIQRRFRSQKLSHPSAVEQVPEDQTEEPASSPLKQRILVHLRRNHCQISLDTTGNHLHQRGYRLHHVGAPLRETLAAAILIKAGWEGNTPFIDGMCGSGTLPIEAALLARSLPPGLRRPFLFQKWPSFLDKTWEHLCRKVEEGALSRSPVPILGLDWDENALDVARGNAERAGTGEDIQWGQMDFFTFNPREHHIQPGLLVLNPPYGIRLAGGGKELFERIGGHLRSAFQGWRAVVLVPERPLATALKVRSMRLWNITHGGIPITAAMMRL
jgi:putative N6-adenine-specific DNA methylase